MGQVWCLVSTSLLIVLAGFADVPPTPPVEQIPGWLSFHGNVSEVRITLTLNSGWGGAGKQTIVLVGTGRGEYTRMAAPLGGTRGQALHKELTFARRDFVKLLNRFFEARFFQLGNAYFEGAWFVSDSSGAGVVMVESQADGGHRELTVELGAYRKSVRFVRSEDLSPAYLRGLGEAVVGFAEAAGMPHMQ